MADVELGTLGGVIKTAYEGNVNTNAFTDAEKSKLAGIDAEISDLQENKEDSLGNPAVDGYVLSSNTAGTRQWVPQQGGVNTVNGLSGDVNLTTDLVPEGENNKYATQTQLNQISQNTFREKKRKNTILEI